MNPNGFALSAFALAGILLATSCVGWLLAPFFVPRGRGRYLERAGWSLATGFLLLALHVVVAFALGLRPGWVSFLALSVAAFAVTRPFRLSAFEPLEERTARLSLAEGLLLALITAGIGTAIWDFLDGADPGAVRRLGLASLLAAGTKNEGLLLLATGVLVLAWRTRRARGRPPWAAEAAIVLPGLASVLLHRLVLGVHAIRGLDPKLLADPGLAARVRETLREEFVQLARPAWPALIALLVLLLARPRGLASNPIVALVAASILVYLALPVACPFGPLWLVHWTVGRITCALFPLLVAGIGAQWAGEWPDGAWTRTRRTNARVQS